MRELCLLQTCRHVSVYSFFCDHYTTPSISSLHFCCDVCALYCDCSDSHEHVQVALCDPSFYQLKDMLQSYFNAENLSNGIICTLLSSGPV